MTGRLNFIVTLYWICPNICRNILVRLIAAETAQVFLSVILNSKALLCGSLHSMLVWQKLLSRRFTNFISCAPVAYAWTLIWLVSAATHNPDCHRPIQQKFSCDSIVSAAESKTRILLVDEEEGRLCHGASILKIRNVAEDLANILSLFIRLFYLGKETC